MGRACADCGKDISDRHRNAYLCLPCRDKRHRKYARDRSRAIYRDPILAERRRIYSAAWRRQHRIKRPTELVRCEGCGNSFAMNRIGRRRLVCIECSAYHGGYVNVSTYLAQAKRRSERDRARRQRRAA